VNLITQSRLRRNAGNTLPLLAFNFPGLESSMRLEVVTGITIPACPAMPLPILVSILNSMIMAQDGAVLVECAKEKPKSRLRHLFRACM